MRFKIRLILMGLCIPGFAFSGTQHDFDSTIKQWMGKFNAVSTHNQADAFKSQMGFHLIGGQGMVRPVVEDFTPFHIEFPRFSAGCGGIDYTTGGVHMANGEEMIKSFKSIASNGACYAFNLGLQVISPQIAAATKDIQHMANQLNSININSCEVSKSIVQALMPNIERSSQIICSEAAVTNSHVDSYIRAKHKCDTNSAFEDKVLKEVREGQPDFVVGEYNVAWEALKKSRIDDELTKFLFMNITGSIVVSKDNYKDNSGELAVRRKVTVYPPKVKTALDSILYGGKLTQAYQLEKGPDGQYLELDMKMSDLEIPFSQCWKTKIYKQLRSLADKFDSESRGSRSELLSDQDKELLDSTKLPVGSMMTLMSQWSGKAMDLASLNDCAEIIACERLCEFIHAVLGNIRSSVGALETIHMDGSLEEYSKSLSEIEVTIRAYEQRNLQQFHSKQKQVQYLLDFERNLREKSRGV